jgi:hypothetical protein
MIDPKVQQKEKAKYIVDNAMVLLDFLLQSDTTHI